MESGAHHIFLGLWGGFSTFFYLRIAFDNILKNVIFSHCLIQDMTAPRGGGTLFKMCGQYLVVTF